MQVSKFIVEVLGTIVLSTYVVILAVAMAARHLVTSNKLFRIFYRVAKYICEKTRQFRKWVFATPTRIVELTNTGLLLTFPTIMIINSGGLIPTHPYRNFPLAMGNWPWVCGILLGLIQLWAMVLPSIKSDQVSGLALQVSMLGYFIIALIFGSDYPPISTAFTTYLIYAGVTGLAGHELLAKSKARDSYTK